jgi:hypothetical protein
LGKNPKIFQKFRIVQEVWEIFRHWKVTETGHFFAGVGDDGLVDTCSSIFHIFLKD